ncbi:hypothetical protein D9M72_373750 [compost metagenome]
MELGDGSGRGQEAAPHVLGVEPELEGVAAGFGVLGDAQGFAVSDPELLLDQVDPRGFLGDGVLHLKPRIHFQERDGSIRGNKELHGAGAGVAGFPADRLRGAVNLPPLIVAEERCGGFLHELLVPALQGAVAGPDDDDVAVGIGKDLRFDVPWTVQVAFHEAFAAAEGCHGFADCGVEGFLDLVHVPDHLEPAAAAAEGRLDGDRQAVLLGEGAGFRSRIHGTVASGHEGGAGADGDFAGGDLVAELPDGFRRRADPGQPGIQHCLREIGVLGQEAVAGVDGVRT